MDLYKLIVFIITLVVFDVPSDPILLDPIAYEGPVELSEIYTKTLKAIKSESITRHLIRSCDNTDYQKHCINTALGFAGIESSMFKTCKKNNCFGMRELVKPKSGDQYYRVIAFSSINEGIDYWVENYYKPYLSRIKTTKDAINTGYCSGECENPGSAWSKTIERFIGYIK